MGKLSKIRRAIIKEPQKFYKQYRNNEAYAIPADVDHKGNVYTKSYLWAEQSHRNFVKKVLSELGYNVK